MSVDQSEQTTRSVPTWIFAAGAVAPVVRFIDVAGLGLLVDGYSHVSQAISELGDRGSSVATWHRLLTVATGMGQLSFATGLWRRRSRALSVVVAVSGVGYLGSAVFQPSLGLPVPGDPGFSINDVLHAAFGIPTGVALAVAPIVGCRARPAKRFRAISLAVGAIAAVLGVASLVTSGTTTAGFWQRAFNVPAFVWQAWLAAWLIQQAGNDPRPAAS